MPTPRASYVKCVCGSTVEESLWRLHVRINGGDHKQIGADQA